MSCATRPCRPLVLQVKLNPIFYEKLSLNSLSYWDWLEVWVADAVSDDFFIVLFIPSLAWQFKTSNLLYRKSNVVLLCREIVVQDWVWFAYSNILFEIELWLNSFLQGIPTLDVQISNFNWLLLFNLVNVEYGTEIGIKF